MSRLVSLSFALLLAGTAILPAPARAARTVAAAPVAFTSAYTDLNTQCKGDPKVTEGDIPQQCKGYGGYRIAISYSATASMISVESLDGKETKYLATQAFAYDGQKGRKVEWRMADGKPFAVIMRITKYREDSNFDNPYDVRLKSGEALLIKGLPGYDQIDAEVDAKTPNANVEARKLADAGFGGGK